MPAEQRQFDIEQVREFLHIIDPNAEQFCYQFFKKTKDENGNEKEVGRPPVLLPLNDASIQRITKEQSLGFNVAVVNSLTLRSTFVVRPILHSPDGTRTR